MTVAKGIELIKRKFEEKEGPHVIPMMRANKTFTGFITPKGISVDNLGSAPLLEWDVFKAALELLIQNGVGVPVFKGHAMKGPLGSEYLPHTSVEGYIAKNVFHKPDGTNVFRKISAISGVLVYCGLCVHGPKTKLILRDFWAAHVIAVTNTKSSGISCKGWIRIAPDNTRYKK